jgi:hypothetical protein
MFLKFKLNDFCTNKIVRKTPLFISTERSLKIAPTRLGVEADDSSISLFSHSSI